MYPHTQAIDFTWKSISIDAYQSIHCISTKQILLVSNIHSNTGINCEPLAWRRQHAVREYRSRRLCPSSVETAEQQQSTRLLQHLSSAVSKRLANPFECCGNYSLTNSASICLSRTVLLPWVTQRSVKKGLRRCQSTQPNSPPIEDQSRLPVIMRLINHNIPLPRATAGYRNVKSLVTFNSKFHLIACKTAPASFSCSHQYMNVWWLSIKHLSLWTHAFCAFLFHPMRRVGCSRTSSAEFQEVLATHIMLKC